MATPLVPGYDYIYIDDDGKLKSFLDHGVPAGGSVIADADGTLADVTAKFNVLLAKLRVVMDIDS